LRDTPKPACAKKVTDTSTLMSKVVIGVRAGGVFTTRGKKTVLSRSWRQNLRVGSGGGEGKEGERRNPRTAIETTPPVWLWK